MATVAVLVAAILLSLPAKAAEPLPRTLRAAVPANFPPLYTLDAAGRPTGFAVDVMNAVATAAGLRVEYRVGESWSDVFEALILGEADLVPSLGITDRGRELFRFSDPVGTFPISVFARADTKNLSWLGDLEGRTVGVVRHSEAGELLKRRTGIDLEVFTSVEQAMFKLLAGHIDAVAYAEPAGWKVAREAGVEEHLRVVGVPLMEVKHAIAVRPENAHLIPLLDPAVHEVVASPLFTRIFETWFGAQKPYWTPARMGWATVALLSVMMLAMAGWRHFSLVSVNRDLRRSVAERQRAEAELRRLNEELEQRVERRTAALKEREEAASRAHDQLREVINTVPLPMILVEEGASKILLANEAAGAVFGLTTERSCPHGAGDLCMVVEDQESLMGRLRHQDCLDHEELRMCGADGNALWCLASFRKMVFDGRPAVLGAFLDITGRKESEEELRKLSLAVEKSPAVVVITDTKGSIEYVNPRFSEVTGYTLQDVIGKTPGIVSSGMTRTDTYAEMWDTLRQDEIWHGEFENRRKDGTTYWVAASIAPILDETGTTTHYVSVQEDVTELRRAKEEAEAANQAKSEFLSSMSHELRTPLNAILGFAQLLEAGRKEPLSERQTGQVQYIMKAGQHLLDLINEVLDLAKIEAGRLSLEVTEVDSRSLLDECLSLTATQADRFGVTLEDGTTGTALPAINADYTRTKQVLLNLLSNAVKYNRERGRVHILATPNEHHLRFRITDTGHGIPAAKQAELFRPFHRLGAESTEIEGTGVGLTITKQLVESMEGAIDFESEEGEGSAFWVDLPLATKAAETGAETDTE